MFALSGGIIWNGSDRILWNAISPKQSDEDPNDESAPNLDVRNLAHIRPNPIVGSHRTFGILISTGSCRILLNFTEITKGSDRTTIPRDSNEIIYRYSIKSDGMLV